MKPESAIQRAVIKRLSAIRLGLLGKRVGWK